MKYFFTIQDGLNDTDPNFYDPFNTLLSAKTAANIENSDLNVEPKRIFVILQQHGDGYFETAEIGKTAAPITWKEVD